MSHTEVLTPPTCIGIRRIRKFQSFEVKGHSLDLISTTYLDMIIRPNPQSLSREEVPWDYAVVELDSNIGDTVGYWGFKAYNPEWNGGDFWRNVGYGGESCLPFLPFRLDYLPNITA